MIDTRPMVTDESVVFRLPDGGPDLDGARLLPDLAMPDDGLEFRYADGAWELRLDRPPVWRMEYRVQLRHLDGDVEEVCDPGNPLRAPGAFGDKSVVEFPDYVTPAWLTADQVEGTTTEVADQVTLWSPAGGADEPMPLLVAHDGPEYAELAGLTAFSAAMIRAGRLPRHRVALLAPGDRDDEYCANPSHAEWLVETVLPALREAGPVRGPVVGMGASLGGLAMLHAQYTHPDLFGGLFLQSASFFTRALDPQEQGFSCFAKVEAFVTHVRRKAPPATVPVVLTCGKAEENLANNRRMTAVLVEQGYPAQLVEVPDAHNYVGWRDAFDPALADLLRVLWGV